MEAFLALAQAIADLFRGIFDLLGEIVDSISMALYRRKKRKQAEFARESKIDAATVFAQNTELFKTGAFPNLEDFMDGMFQRFCEDADAGRTRYPQLEIMTALIAAGGDLYLAEGLNSTPPSPPVSTDPIVVARYKDQMADRIRKASDPNTLELIDSTVRQCIEKFTACLPPLAVNPTKEESSSPMIPLFDVLPNIPKALQALTLPLYSSEVEELGLFSSTRKKLNENADKLGITDLEKFEGDPKELAEAFLADTPFSQILSTRAPFILPEETRFAGHWLIAPPGRGKTTLLHSMVKDDLDKDASLILIDSKGDLIEPIKRLSSVRDRLILIEPLAESAFSLNPLDVSGTSVVHVVNLIEYILAGLLEAKFTALQSALFRNVVPAIIEAIPDPTLDTFKEVLGKGLPNLERLDSRTRRFFEDRETGFHSKTYESTRKEVVWRLDYLMTNPILRSMFSATKTKLDMGREMDAGKVIIIDNSKAILGDEGAEFFGRFFIALIARAAQQRSGQPAASKKPVYCYIDECQSVIAKDARIPVLIDECRSQKIALILAHQRTAQLTPPVLDAVANCAIRMANSDDDARFLSAKLRMDAEVLRSLPRGTFGAFVRDFTSHGIQLQVPKIDLESLPTMTDEELATLRNQMRETFASPSSQPTGVLEPAMEPAPSNPALHVQPAQHDPGEPAADWS